MQGFPDDVSLSASDWPQGCREPRPGDLHVFIPQGFGLGAPAIVRPYGGPPQQSYYGFDQPQAHPLLNGPLTEPSGGTLYFDGDASLQTLQETLRLMGVYETMDYVAFGNSSSDPISERYLDQMRLVSHSALASIFGATTSEPPPQQRLHALAAVCAFAAAQRSKE